MKLVYDGVSKDKWSPLGSIKPIFGHTFGAAGIISLSTNCEGSSGNLFDANTISQASSYQWILPAGLSSTFAGNVTTDTLISISFAIGTTTGTISVTGINSCGSGIDTANYFFTASPLPLAAGAITGDSIISACTHQSGITYSIAAITNATNYVWTLPATATIVGNADTTSILVNYSAYGISGTVSVYGTNSCGAGASSSLAVNYIAIPKAEICGITVDTTSQKGVLSWQRPLESYADSIVILRKNTSTLQYDRIATVDNVSPGAYLDASSSPNLRYETYKLAVKDSCGNIGDSSIAVTHKTIYLYGLLGWSNIPKSYWTAYEGISDTGRYYNVLRDSSGVGVFKIIEDSIPYNASLNYTDMNGAACLTCRYLIELVYSTDCDPSLRMMTSKSTSRSNVANRIAMPPDPIQTAVKNISTDEIKFSLQPNPAHENILISFQEAMKICSLELYNLIGEKIWSEQLAQVTYQTKQLISAEQLPRGAYLLKLASEKGISFRKIILN